MIGYGFTEISTKLANEVTQLPCVASDLRCQYSSLSLEGLLYTLEHGNSRFGAMGSDHDSEVYLVAST